MKNFFKILSLAALMAGFSVQTVFAEVVNVDTSGNYIMSDDKNESVKNAQKQARTEAIRKAREKAEEYIKTQNQNLTPEEIQRIARKVLKIADETTIVRLVKGSNKQVEVVSNIKATFDTDKIKKILQRRGEKNE